MSKVKISEDILKIKDLIGSPKKVKVRDSKEEFFVQLKELGHRIEKLEEKFKREQSSVDLKRKNQIIHLLKNEEMASSELGKKLGLSRSRVNQYLKVMEMDSIVKGEFRGRKKFYRVVRK